jgi:hypothetical protein
MRTNVQTKGGLCAFGCCSLDDAVTHFERWSHWKDCLETWFRGLRLDTDYYLKIVIRGFCVQQVHSTPSFPGRASLLYELVRGKCGVKVWSTAHDNRRKRIPSPCREPCRFHKETACEGVKEGKPPRNERDEGKGEVEGESEKSRHGVLACI